jgi:ABC-type spermidine/putrescine transport system permease subunit II
MGAAGAPFSWTLRRYQAFFNDQQFVNNAVPVAFLAFMLAIIGYFWGAACRGRGVVFTVIALAVAAAMCSGSRKGRGAISTARAVARHLAYRERFPFRWGMLQ